MARKSLSISLAASFEGKRGVPDMTVEDALEYLAGEDEGSIEEVAEAAIVYAARRKMALAKDQDRFSSGKLAARIYGVRLVEEAPDKVADALGTYKEATVAALARAAKRAKPRKATRKARKAS